MRIVVQRDRSVDPPGCVFQHPARLGWSVAIIVAIALVGWAASLVENKQSHISTLEEQGRNLYEPGIDSVMQKLEGCEVTRSFYNGWKADDQQFFWSVDCRGGRQFLLSVKGKTGDASTLGCDVAKAVSIQCFQKW